MSNVALRALSFAAAALVPACSATSDPDSALLGMPEDSESSEQGISGSVAAGSILQATANVNLRTGPSTSKTILDVVPDGAEVTVVSPSPTSGFYRVEYQQTIGWSFGKYYQLVSNGGGSGGASDAVCTGEGLSSWGCSGSFGIKKMADCEYYATAFGCWKDSNGQNHSDPGDNCIPACLSQAQQSICSGLSGPSCERSVSWFAAGKGRWPCMTRLAVSNPKNGKSAVVVVLDAGPACWVEASVGHAVVDLSYPAAHWLFDGGTPGASEKKLVVVEEVDSSTPLGPQ